MKKFMLGKKAGMTQIFDEQGAAIPVTVIDCGPLTVIRKKNEETDSYEAVQVGYAEAKENKLNKPDMGQFKKAETKPFRKLAEFRVEGGVEAYEVGQEINVADMFAAGDVVDVQGVSKGKGYAGNVKRHNQKGGIEAHGSKYHREVGSMGSSATPSKILKGKKLPGQLGNKVCTVQNLDVVLVDGERNILCVKGAVPGSRGSVLTITDSVKVSKINKKA